MAGVGLGWQGGILGTGEVQVLPKANQSWGRCAG